MQVKTDFRILFFYQIPNSILKLAEDAAGRLMAECHAFSRDRMREGELKRGECNICFRSAGTARGETRTAAETCRPAVSCILHCCLSAACILPHCLTSANGVRG